MTTATKVKIGLLIFFVGAFFYDSKIWPNKFFKSAREDYTIFYKAAIHSQIMIVDQGKSAHGFQIDGDYNDYKFDLDSNQGSEFYYNTKAGDSAFKQANSNILTIVGSHGTHVYKCLNFVQPKRNN